MHPMNPSISSRGCFKVTEVVFSDEFLNRRLQRFDNIRLKCDRILLVILTIVLNTYKISGAVPSDSSALTSTPMQMIK